MHMEEFDFSNAASLKSATLPKINSFTDIAQRFSHTFQNNFFPEQLEMVHIVLLLFIITLETTSFLSKRKDNFVK